MKINGINYSVKISISRGVFSASSLTKTGERRHLTCHDKFQIMLDA
jgi:hypothetical protein